MIKKSVLLITRSIAFARLVADQIPETRFTTRTPALITAATWCDASLVLIDADDATALSQRTLPTRNNVIMLASTEQLIEPSTWMGAVQLGAETVIDIGTNPDWLRRQMQRMVGEPAFVVTVIDPDPSGTLGRVTAASIAIQGHLHGQRTGLLAVRSGDYRLPGLLTGSRIDDYAGPDPDGALVTMTRAQGASTTPAHVHRALRELGEERQVLVVHAEPGHDLVTLAALSHTDVLLVTVSPDMIRASEMWRLIQHAVLLELPAHVCVIGRTSQGDMNAAVDLATRLGYPSVSGVQSAATDPTTLLNQRARTHLWHQVISCRAGTT